MSLHPKETDSFSLFRPKATKFGASDVPGQGQFSLERVSCTIIGTDTGQEKLFCLLSLSFGKSKTTVPLYLFYSFDLGYILYCTCFLLDPHANDYARTELYTRL